MAAAAPPQEEEVGVYPGIDQATDDDVYNRIVRDLGRINLAREEHEGAHVIKMVDHLTTSRALPHTLVPYSHAFLDPAEHMGMLVNVMTASLMHTIWEHPIVKQLRVTLHPLCVGETSVTKRRLCRILGASGCMNILIFGDTFTLLKRKHPILDYDTGWALPTLKRNGATFFYDVIVDPIHGYYARIYIRDHTTDPPVVTLYRMALFSSVSPVQMELDMQAARKIKEQEMLAAV